LSAPAGWLAAAQPFVHEGVTQFLSWISKVKAAAAVEVHQELDAGA
jgi:hypothetical protein